MNLTQEEIDEDIARCDEESQYCECDREPLEEECISMSWCEIIGRTFAYRVDEPEYPSEWQYGEDGQPKCTAFTPLGLHPRCEQTMEMFSDQETRK